MQLMAKDLQRDKGAPCEPAPWVMMEAMVFERKNPQEWIVGLATYDGSVVRTCVDPTLILDFNPQTQAGRIRVPCLAVHDDFSILLLPSEVLETQTRFVKVRSGQLVR